MSGAVHYYKGKILSENQKNGNLHFFVFDHFLFRWLPDSFRRWARLGLINPTIPDVVLLKDTNKDENEKIVEDMESPLETPADLARFGKEPENRKSTESNKHTEL